MINRILFIHDHRFIEGPDNRIFSPGGFPSSTWSKYLEHCGEVNVVARSAGFSQEAEDKYVESSHSQVSFSFLPNISSIKGLISVRSSVKESLVKLIKDSNFVVIRLPSELGLMGAKLCEELKINYAIEVVGCVHDALQNHGSLAAKIYSHIAYLRMRRAILKASNILYVTDHSLQEKYPHKKNSNTVSASNVVINSSDLISTEPSIIPPIKKVGMIGNYSSNYKGIDIAIKALAKLNFSSSHCDSVPDLYILGKGEPDRYISLARSLGVLDKVFFDPPLPSGEKVFEWIDKLDLYIQPSMQEGLPRALIEAMVRGKACLGSNVGGIPELLPSSCIHKAGNDVELAEHIRVLIDSPKMVAELAKRNRLKGAEYTWDKINDRRFKFFNYAISGD